MLLIVLFLFLPVVTSQIVTFGHTLNTAELLCGCAHTCPLIHNITSFPYEIVYDPDARANATDPYFEWMGEIIMDDPSLQLYLYTNKTHDVLTCQYSDVVIDNITNGEVIPLSNHLSHVCLIPRIASWRRRRQLSRFEIMQQQRRGGFPIELMTVDPPRRFISLRLLINKHSSFFIDYAYMEQTKRRLKQCGMCGCDGERLACDIVVGLLVGLVVVVPCLLCWCMYVFDRRAHKDLLRDFCPLLVPPSNNVRTVHIPIPTPPTEDNKKKKDKDIIKKE